MEPPRGRPFTAHAGEVAWGLFLINLILAGVGLLMAPFVGPSAALGLFLGMGIFVSLLLLGVQCVFYLLAIWFERMERD